jgi:subtilisin-like proprotein convertase family protein
MTRTADRPTLAPVAALLLCALLILPAAAGAQKKGKGKKGPGAVNITRSVGAPIPDRGPGAVGLIGVLSSTIEVGKKFKGKRIRDVDVTVQVTGAGPGADSVQDITARLIAPNGASTILFGPGLEPGNLLGPLTLTDESLLVLGFGAPTSATSLFAPYQGRARPAGNPLWKMDNGRVAGTWTLRVLDALNTNTSVLNFWRLSVVAGNPYRTK